MDLQKASVLKRFAAALFDLILIAIVATGLLWVLNLAVGFDGYYQQLEQVTSQYAEAYGIDLSMTQADYDAMTDAEKTEYETKRKQADDAVNQDEHAVYLYNMVVNLALLTVSLSILGAMLLLEFAVPLAFGNGQTLGKKIFSICLMRIDGVKLNNVQLFARTVLGKYAVGTMIPLYAGVMLMSGLLSGFLLLAVVGLLLAQCICIVVSRRNALLHDLLAGTVVVDYTSQQIFQTPEDLMAYQKKIAAERAARQTY